MIDFDLSDIKRACAEAQRGLESAAERVVVVAAEAGIAAAKARHRYRDRTGRLTNTAFARLLRAGPAGAEGEMVWPVPYASFVDQDTRPHQIVARRARALRFQVGGRVVFARSVQHPGTKGARFVDDATSAAEQALEAEADRAIQTALSPLSR